MRHLIFLLSFLFGSAYAQDTVVFKRVYIWKYESEEMTNLGSEFVTDLCDSIYAYKSQWEKVEVIFVEEILPNTSVCNAETYLARLKDNCLTHSESDLKGIDFSSACERVEDFKHLEPHFIWYYVKIVLR